MTNSTNDNDFEHALVVKRMHEESKARRERPKTLGQMWTWFKRTAKQVGARRIMASALAAVVGYGVIGQTTGRVNNEIIKFTPAPGTSAVVDWLKLSINRERKTGWGPSATIFRPSFMRIDMSAFQDGQRQIWKRVAQRLETDIARASNSNSFDPDISDTRFLVMLGDHWSPLYFIDAKWSTDASFVLAVKKLDRFQKRMAQDDAKDKAHIYPRIDNLSYLVSDVTHVMGDAQSRLRLVANRAGVWVGPETRRLTYEVLGVMNASCGVLKAVGIDFSKVVEYQSIAGTYPMTVERVCDSIGDYPPVMSNVGGQVAQLDADVSAATNQLEALQRALAAEARQPGPMPR